MILFLRTQGRYTEPKEGVSEDSWVIQEGVRRGWRGRVEHWKSILKDFKTHHFFFFLWRIGESSVSWGYEPLPPPAGYLTAAIELTSLAVSLFKQAQAKEASATPVPKGGVPCIPYPVCPQERRAAFSENSPPGKSGPLLAQVSDLPRQHGVEGCKALSQWPRR